MLAVVRARRGIRHHEPGLGPGRLLRRHRPSCAPRRPSTHKPIHAVGYCLASRGHGTQDLWRIDYHATLHTLQPACSLGTAYFVLLSAIDIRPETPACSCTPPTSARPQSRTTMCSSTLRSSTSPLWRPAASGTGATRGRRHRRAWCLGEIA